MRPVAILVVSRSSSPTWTAAARLRAAGEFGGPGITLVFETLQGIASLTSGERRRVDDHWARAFSSPWTPPPDREDKPAFITGDPPPNVLGDAHPGEPATPWTQTLWIDTSSLLPVRWELFKGGTLTNHFDGHVEAIDLRPPVSPVAPECIR